MPRDTMTKYPCHDSEIKKLNRVSGQIDGVKKMIADCKYCPDILTQLRAARAALKSIEANILETHLKSCVMDAVLSGKPRNAAVKIEELKDLFRRFDES